MCVLNHGKQTNKSGLLSSSSHRAELSQYSHDSSDISPSLQLHSNGHPHVGLLNVQGLHILLSCIEALSVPYTIKSKSCCPPPSHSLLLLPDSAGVYLVNTPVLTPILTTTLSKCFAHWTSSGNSNHIIGMYCFSTCVYKIRLVIIILILLIRSRKVNTLVQIQKFVSVQKIDNDQKNCDSKHFHLSTCFIP